MIYKERTRIPRILLFNDDFKNKLKELQQIGNVVCVTDPPFNIGYHYGKYNDRMRKDEYYKMLVSIMQTFPCVIIHYPESLHELSLRFGEAPLKVCSWVYNSNTPRQHRDVAYYRVKPSFKNALQPYKNPNDKRIKERISNGILGGGYV